MPKRSMPAPAAQDSRYKPYERMLTGFNNLAGGSRSFELARRREKPFVRFGFSNVLHSAHVERA